MLKRLSAAVQKIPAAYATAVAVAVLVLSHAFLQPEPAAMSALLCIAVGLTTLHGGLRHGLATLTLGMAPLIILPGQLPSGLPAGLLSAARASLPLLVGPLMLLFIADRCRRSGSRLAASLGKWEEASDSQKFLNLIIENIPNMIFIKDARNLRFVRFNKAGENLLGHSREQLIGKNDQDFFPSDQADFFTQEDRRVLSNGVVKDIPEEPLTTRHGVRYLHTKKIPILDEDGVPQYLLGISEDITLKKEAAEPNLNLLRMESARAEVEKSAAHFAILSEAGAALSRTLEEGEMIRHLAAIIVHNRLADWCIIEITDGRPSRVGAKVIIHRDHALQLSIDQLLQDSPASLARAGSLPDMGGRQTAETSDWSGEVESRLIETAPGDTAASWAGSAAAADLLARMGVHSIIQVPLKSYQSVFGKIILVSAAPDRPYGPIEFALAKELGKRGSYAIENARLFAKAQDASRAKSSFLANMSHEIRTPLGAIIGFAELLGADAALSGEQTAHLSTIAQNGKHLLGLVDQILDLSKVESEQATVELIPFDIAPLMEEVTNLLMIKAQEKKLLFAVKIDPDVPATVESDPTRVRQILINLIGNAIKFTEHGSVSVHIGLGKGPAPRTRNAKPETGDRIPLEFRIIDTGIGLSEEQAGFLFRPFVQADDSTTRLFGGTGLGLFLSKKLARLLSGNLTLERSSQGAGSEFLLTVPVGIPALASKAAGRMKRETPPASPESLNREDWGGKGKVLVVDDVQDNRVLVCNFLRNWGVASDTAENGQEAVEKAKGKKYQLVLMDIQMPHLDGVEATKRLRAAGCKSPIVALTAHAMRGDREHLLTQGFDDYLCKPIDFKNLNSLVQRYLHPDR